MSLNATSEIINAVQRARTSNDPGEVACGLLSAAVNVIADDDQVAKTFLARMMLKIARDLDADVLRAPTTQ